MGTFKKVGFGFTVVPNEVINDERITWKAKGLFAYLASKPDNWDFSSHRIVKEGKGERKTVLSGLKELENIGYLVRKKGSNGRIRHELHASPEEPEQKKATVRKRHRAKNGPLSKKDILSKKYIPSSANSEHVKPMKHYEEETIEVDSLGDVVQTERAPEKFKNKSKLYYRLIDYYKDLTGEPAPKNRYLLAMKELVVIASNICDTEEEVEKELRIRIKVGVQYYKLKEWGHPTLEKLAKKWNEIPKWRKEL